MSQLDDTSPPPTSTLNLPTLSPKEKNDVNALFLLYQHAVRFQHSGAHIRAFHYYKTIIPFIGTDPCLWLRLAECCVHTLYRDYNSLTVNKKLRITTYPARFDETAEDSLYLLEDNCELSEADKARIELYGINVIFAEEAINTCLLLLSSDTRVELKMSATILGAFVAIKRRRYGLAIQLANEVLTQQCSSETKMKAFLIKMEAFLRTGDLESLKYCYLDANKEADFKSKTTNDYQTYMKILVACHDKNWEEAHKLIEKQDLSLVHRNYLAITAFVLSKLDKMDELVELINKHTGKHNYDQS